MFKMFNNNNKMLKDSPEQFNPSYPNLHVQFPLYRSHWDEHPAPQSAVHDSKYFPFMQL